MLFRIYFFYLKDNHNHPKNSRLKNIFATLVWVFKSLTLRNLFAIKFSFDRETRELILYLDQKALSRIKTEQKCLTFVFVPQRLYGALLTSLIFSYGISITTWYSINSDKNYLKNKSNKVIRTFVSLDGDVSHQICKKLLDQSYEYSHKIVLSHYWLMYQILKALRSSIEMWWHLIAALCWLLTVIYCNLNPRNLLLLLLQNIAIAGVWIIVWWIVKRILPKLSQWIWRQLVNPRSFLFGVLTKIVGLTG